MNSNTDCPDFDHLLYEHGQVFRVKNGVKSPASEGDLPKEHKDSGCTECTFVANRESIYVSPPQVEQCTPAPKEFLKTCLGLFNPEDKIIELGNFTFPKLPGHQMFYLFYCIDCEHVSVDYLHGNKGYLTCQNYKVNIQLRGARFFIKNGLESPPSFLQRVRILREIIGRCRKIKSAKG